MSDRRAAQLWIFGVFLGAGVPGPSARGGWRAMRVMAVLLALLGCGSSATGAEKPNIVFLLADDMRPDAIGAFGHPVVQTPNVDALVREGATFSRAIVGYPICHVSRAEIFTGCPAFRTGVQYRGTRIDPGLALWAETLRQAGYRTWFSGKWHNDGQPKTRGFEATGGLYSSGGGKGGVELPDAAGRKATGYTGWTFKSDDGRVELDRGVGLTPDTDRVIADGAISLISAKQAEAKPFFLQVSFTGPHDPRLWPRGYEHRYDAAKIPLPKNFAPEHPFDHGNAGGRDEILLKLPRDPGEVRAELATYYAVIANLDEQVGRIVAALRASGAWENTIVIFSSDHGLALGSHGLTGKQNQYEHTIGVPLILRGPGIPGGERIAAQCYLRDLFPTTCELAGIPIPATVQSRSLVPALHGGTIYPAVFGCFTDTQRMIRDERWKLIWYPKLPRYQLFDLASDPDEMHDLSADPQQAPRLGEMKAKLEVWLKENGDPLFAGH